MIIGISGGRGSGKSTISKLLMEYLEASVIITCDTYMHKYSKKLEKCILDKLDIIKDPNIFAYNYYFENYNNVKKWISVIEKEVINYV